MDAARKRRTVNIVAIAIPTLLVVGSGVGKLLAPPAMVEGLAKYGTQVSAGIQSYVHTQ